MIEVNKVRKQLADYLTVSKRSQASVSKELGISTGTLSQFLSGDYAGSNESVAEKVSQFLVLEERRKHRTPPPTFTRELSNTKLVYSQLEYLRVANNIATVIGAAGCGKTTALKHYAEETNGVVYAQADATKKSPRTVLVLIVKALGLKPRGSSSDLLDSLVEELTGTNRLIIIDEAQHLTERSFDALRALNDKAGVSVVYAGTPDIIARMYGRHEQEFDQVYSRIGCTCKLKNHYTLKDIENVFREFNLDKTVIKQLYNVSSRKGGLRLAINIFKLANDLAVTSGTPLEVEHLKVAAQRVGSGGDLI